MREGGRLCYGYQPPPLIDQAFSSLTCAVRKTHEFASKGSIDKDQVLFQDVSDVEKAVGVLRRYREMLQQGLQLVEVELSTKCFAQQRALHK